MASTDILGTPSLIDVVKEFTSMDANKAYIKAAQVLDRKIALLKILPMVRSNQMISHIGSRDSYIGTVTPKAIGAYTTPTATSSTPFAEPISLFEDYGVVSKELYDIMGVGRDQWRFNQDRRKIEGIGQSLEYNMFYDSIAANSGGINGLATRFAASTSRPNADTSWNYNVELGGGSGSDVMSVWLVEPGEDKVYLIYPAAVNGVELPAGLSIRNLGESTETNSSGQKRQVLTTHLQWYIGLAIGDERCVQRYANIETSGASNTFDPNVLIKLKNNLPNRGTGAYVIGNRTFLTQAEQLANDKANGFYTKVNEMFGGEISYFHGMPIILGDKLLTTETAIS